MSRKPCCDGEGLKKGAWTAEEDKKLIACIQEHGEGCWHLLPEKAGLKRCGKSCRLRWNNYLKPDIKRGDFTLEEDQTIIKLHAACGNKWSVIARQLPGRTDNEIKNYWNTHLKKRLIKKGIDPVTHKPFGSCQDPEKNPNPKNAHKPGGKSRSRWSQPSTLLNKMASKLSEATSCEALSQLLEGDSSEPPPDDNLSKNKVISSSTSTSRLLNKMASRVTSIKGFLSASIEGCSTPSSKSSPSETNYVHEPHDVIMGTDNTISPSSKSMISVSGEDSVPMEIYDQDFELSEVLDICGSEFNDNSNSNNNNYQGCYDRDALSGGVDEVICTMEGCSDFLIDHAYECMNMPCAGWEETYNNDEWSHI